MMEDRFSVPGRVAMVTGAGRGIGRSIALALAGAGAHVVLAARTTQQVEDVAKEIGALGRQALALTVDVASPTDIDLLVDATMTRFGRIDILVNSAGISPYYKRAENLTSEMWDEIMAVNLKGAFFCCQKVGKVMIEQKKGSIVNVSSKGGVGASPRLAAYNASKAGLILVTKTLALEWAQHNIRVNALAPGWVATDFTAGLRGNQDLLPTLVARVPMNRFAEPDEIASAALFLASDAASYMTGAVILIDGGITAA